MFLLHRWAFWPGAKSLSFTWKLSDGQWQTQKFNFYWVFLRIMQKKTDRKEQFLTLLVHMQQTVNASPRQSRHDCECSTKTLNNWAPLKGQKIFFSFIDFVWEFMWLFKLHKEVREFRSRTRAGDIYSPSKKNKFARKCCSHKERGRLQMWIRGLQWEEHTRESTICICCVKIQYYQALLHPITTFVCFKLLKFFLYPLFTHLDCED